MNAFICMIRFDGQPVHSEEMEAARFSSPYWVPDHTDILCDGSIGFSSVHRFLTPESGHQTMPYRHLESHCIIVGDIFLTYRDELVLALGVHPQLSDCELVMEAYHRWGRDCLAYLTGTFGFVIWDPRTEHVFCATDPLCKVPCFYYFSAQDTLVISNYMSSFRQLCPPLTLNTSFLKAFLTDAIRTYDTCYTEVSKLVDGHYALISSACVTNTRYYSTRRASFPSARFKTREECYAAFRQCFRLAVRQYLPANQQITAHISGGLGSTSVACMAALLLKDQPLFGFTAIPGGITASSFRKGWHCNEMHIIQSVLQCYPNIFHQTYCYTPERDTISSLLGIYSISDMPIRNFFNMDWIIGSLTHAAQRESRILLTGLLGNFTISFKGKSFKQFCCHLVRGCSYIVRPMYIINRLRPLLLFRFILTVFLRKLTYLLSFHLRYFLLFSPHLRCLESSTYSAQLWHGVYIADPTTDCRVLEFCYSLPNRYFFKSFTPFSVLNHRLLVREGLVGIVPEAVRYNPNRGEQSADWVVRFNRYCADWRDCIYTSASQFSFLQKIYDFHQIDHIFRPMPPDQHQRNLPFLVKTGLILSMTFFLSAISVEKKLRSLDSVS